MSKQVQHYESTDEPIPNPGRGLSHYTQTRYAEDGSGHTPLDVWQLRRWKREGGLIPNKPKNLPVPAEMDFAGENRDDG